MRGGFTLVESLATLVLVAIILPVALRAIAAATATAGEARHRMEASSLAEAQLSELVETGEWQGSELSGNFAPEWPQYRWSAEVTDGPVDTVRQLAVRVEWDSGAGTRSVVLTTLVSAESE
jgi:prepilin-type N-terminal cleavage/methylation domain-containing protein